MQLYAITIRATVEKTMTLAAASLAEAEEAAHEIFSTHPDEHERYEQDTISTKELAEAA